MYPNRREEFDSYMTLILDLAIRFSGPGFYQYHILFSSQAAARLQQFNQNTFWGSLDQELYCRIFASRASICCSFCGAPSHPATACVFPARRPPTQAQAPAPVRPATQPVPIPPMSAKIPIPQGVDKRGRPIMLQGGKAICNNFNASRCTLSQCRFLHTCSFCGGGHSRSIPALSKALQDHPDPEFVRFLITGFSEGFRPSLISLPSTSFTCKNLQSALKEPGVVDSLLAKEVKDGHMIGPFTNPPFSPFRISPIGIATRKYSGKKRLIIDLSAPHGCHIPSINSLIPSDEFALKYATIDHAISLIKLAGHAAWLSKADIKNAFKVLPIHPDFWRFFGVCWKGAFYFAVRLTFGCKSSPKLFDCLSEALCWILLNKHDVPFLVHLLDDFLLVSPISSPPARDLLTLKNVFSSLGVPLLEEKTLGPSTSLEFLGITLDTVKYQASLPTEKLNRISLLLSNFLVAISCSKRQLLSLLGHLNFAMRIIPQGRAFISHLLTLASSVKSLHSVIILSKSVKSELRFWHLLLSNWNGITLFYRDIISAPLDISLFTDAAPSAGFGGYYLGRWFSAPWPNEFLDFIHKSGPSSSALFEIYPVVIATLLWGHEWTSTCVAIQSDNLAVVDIINKGRSNALPIMPFVRRLTWLSIKHQFILRAKYIPGYLNSVADSLSRFAFQKFRTLAPEADPLPIPVPPFSATTFHT
ncbi:uncharacterized protein [Eucyclogobius newberryi]|uniref:uncharacterized protein n=1 Tax=Eucyclogobius newberryi TaxID=166745 RepID=UPI003B5A82CE